MRMLSIGLRRDSVSGKVRLGYCAINEYPLDLKDCMEKKDSCSRPHLMRLKVWFGRVPFSYLKDIHMRFMKNYGRVASYAPAYSMNDEFSRVLHQQMEFFSSNPSADTLNRVRGEVNEASVRTIMVDNIEKILERGDRIELLVDKTATMQDSAFHFKKQSRRLSRALWMKNVKLLKTPPLIGLVDMLDCCASVHNNCCFLWRNHSTILQIIMSSFVAVLSICSFSKENNEKKKPCCFSYPEGKTVISVFGDQKDLAL
ncbi:hypothetical protein HYC85_025120 [Camellia sinensis]|uniref:V-SNARE coiled-coil homology domain-containing protein n=1 Tax=Camellia sinensis TaxID=4442 RepID=A0A7J7GDX0_CAMSI|nr:hypothetical protein HYC85_025120 [Camellia sinensis]